MKCALLVFDHVMELVPWLDWEGAVTPASSISSTCTSSSGYSAPKLSPRSCLRRPFNSSGHPWYKCQPVNPAFASVRPALTSSALINAVMCLVRYYVTLVATTFRSVGRRWLTAYMGNLPGDNLECKWCYVHKTKSNVLRATVVKMVSQFITTIIWLINETTETVSKNYFTFPFQISAGFNISMTAQYHI